MTKDNYILLRQDDGRMLIDNGSGYGVWTTDEAKAQRLDWETARAMQGYYDFMAIRTTIDASPERKAAY